MTSMSGGGGGGGAGGTLPTGVNQSWQESQGGTTNVWQPATNEGLANLLINTTSTGDAGNRADHFLGSSLRAGWANQGTAFTGTSVKNSVFSMTKTSGVGYELQPYTPTGAFRVEARMTLLAGPSGTSADFGLVVRDSTAGGDTGNQLWMIIGYANPTTLTVTFYTVAAGVVSSISNLWVGATGDFSNGQPFYLAIEADGAGNCDGQFSINRSMWIGSLVTTVPAGFTAAKMGFRHTGAVGTPVCSVDFIDVVT